MHLVHGGHDPRHDGAAGPRAGLRATGRRGPPARRRGRRPRRFAPHQVVFREGDDSDTCYLVRDGHARALREHADGRQIAIAQFGQGDIFGELAMFDAERRSATVEAIDDLTALALLGSDMRRLCAATRTSRSSS